MGVFEHESAGAHARLAHQLVPRSYDFRLMSERIIGLDEWLETAPGRYLLAWERQRFEAAVADLFGFHAIQLGLTEFDTLASNRMPHRWVMDAEAKSGGHHEAVAEFSALPFPAASIDLVCLPHALEFSGDPHSTLREVERVLVPEGRVVISGFNPASLWGLRQQRGRFYRRLGWDNLYLPQAGEFIGYWRLRDWLRLLGFEVESSRFGCYRPALRSEEWLRRMAWMEPIGARWWPILGASYMVVAVKRVRGVKLLGAAWRRSRTAAATPVPVTNRFRNTKQEDR